MEKMDNVDFIPQPQICSSHHDSRDNDDPDFDDDEDNQQQMMWDDDEQYIPENVPPVNNINMKKLQFGIYRDADKASNNSFEFSDEGTKKDYMKLKISSKDSAVVFDSQK